MKLFVLEQAQLAALGLSRKDMDDLARTAQAEIDRHTTQLASLSRSNDKPTATRCAELACYYGHHSPYWPRWNAIQDARGLSWNERLVELSPRGVRWLASWAREAGGLDAFAGAYEHFLHRADRGAVSPVAHDNSEYFSYLFDRADYAKIRDTVSKFFTDPEGPPGSVGYLYERVWLIFALVALGHNTAAEVATKLVKQFSKEGGAWAAMSVTRACAGDNVGAQAAWRRATKCEYIEESTRRIALHYVRPNTSSGTSISER